MKNNHISSYFLESVAVKKNFVIRTRGPQKSNIFDIFTGRFSMFSSCGIILRENDQKVYPPM